jgi:anti-anti-sigma factor
MTLHEQDRVIVLEPHGHLYAGQECDTLEHTLIELAEQGRRVIVDLSGADHLAARCLGILAHAQDIALQRGGRVVVCGANPQQRWLLAKTRLGGPLGLADSREAALQELNDVDALEA